MTTPRPISNAALPDADGRFGAFGGRFVAETLMPPLLALEEAYREAREDPDFQAELDSLLQDYAGRPSPLYYARRLTDHCGGAKIYFKRDELNHTGSHKINACLGQILLAKRMGKKRVIAETGAGQHGVAAATVAARFAMRCLVYMGAKDIARQKPNLFRMRLLGAEVQPVRSGGQGLKDAMNEALRDWVSHVEDTFYIIGTAAGPHPYPRIVRDFQSVIGREVKAQMMEKEGRLPDLLIACVGGGSNALGLFHPFLEEEGVELCGVEAGGRGVKGLDHAAPLNAGSVGILHGSRSYLLQDEEGQIRDGHSVSAGLDYPGVGPEHAFLKESARARYAAIEDGEALQAFQLCAKLEGILPAFEPAHALAQLLKEAPKLPKTRLIVMNMCGRGDKDVFQAAKLLKMDIGEEG